MATNKKWINLYNNLNKNLYQPQIDQVFKEKTAKVFDDATKFMNKCMNDKTSSYWVQCGCGKEFRANSYDNVQRAYGIHYDRCTVEYEVI